VSFNESLANFVGNQATVDFFRARQQLQPKGDQASALLLEQAEREYAFQQEFSGVVTKLYRELSALYARQDLSSASKIEQRQEVFERACAPFRKRYPKASVLRSINNAELMQFVIYMTDLDRFERHFESVGRSWPRFISDIPTLRSAKESHPQ
jgi:predicted aminopeptidase